MAWRCHRWTEVQIEVGGLKVAEVSIRHSKTRSARQALGEYVLDLSLNVTQDLEVEAEAGHRQGTGSQPRAWGMMAAIQTCVDN